MHVDRKEASVEGARRTTGSGTAVLVSIREEKDTTNNRSLLSYSLKAGGPGGSPQLSSEGRSPQVLIPLLPLPAPISSLQSLPLDASPTFRASPVVPSNLADFSSFPSLTGLTC